MRQAPLTGSTMVPGSGVSSKGASRPPPGRATCTTSGAVWRAAAARLASAAPRPLPRYSAGAASAWPGTAAGAPRRRGSASA